MTNPDLGISRKATENLWNLHLALEADLDHWAKLVFEKSTSDQLARRSYIRSLFAEIEGQIFGLKRIALEIYEFEKKHLLPEEVILLREGVPELEAEGKVKTRSANLKFRPNLRFAFRTFAEILNASYVMNVGGRGWAALDSSVAVRNRLTHPKAPEDLNVTDDEISTAGEAHLWFNEEFGSLFKAASLARDIEIRALKNGSAENK